MTREEVEPEPVSENENAMPLYTSLTKNWPKSAPPKKIDDLYKVLYKSNERLPEFDSIIEQLEKRPKLKLNKDWDLGPFVTFPEILVSKRLTKVMALQAVAEARKGNVEFVRKRLKAIHAVSQTIRSCPTYVSFVTGFSQEVVLSAACAESIFSSGGNPEIVSLAQEMLRQARPEVDYSKLIRTEFYSGLAVMRNSSSMSSAMRAADGEVPRWVKKPKRTGLPTKTTLKANLAFFTRSAVGLAQLMKTHQRNPNLAAEVTKFERSIPKTTSAWMTEIIFSVYGPAIEADKKVEARKAVALSTTEMYLHILKTQSVPVSFKQANIDAKDPFVDDQLRTKVREGVLLVYSIGPNKKDDGGPATRGKKSDDFGYSFYLPKGLKLGNSKL